MVAALASVSCFLLFILLPLPEYSLPGGMPRVYEVLPGILFLIALLGYLWKSSWKKDDFEHFFILFLIVSVMTQLTIMPYSQTVNDFDFTLAHLLKKASYIMVLSGLLVNLYAAYRKLKNETTTRKKLEKQLRREARTLKRDKEWFKAITDYTYEWEVWFSHDGQLLYCNDSCERITGYSAAEFLSDSVSLSDLVLEADNTNLLAKLSSHEECEETDDVEFWIRTKQGEERWLNQVARPCYNEEGEYIGRRVKLSRLYGA